LWNCPNTNEHAALLRSDETQPAMNNLKSIVKSNYINFEYENLEEGQ